MEEKIYRQLVDEAFGKVDTAFESVDPDLAESVLSQGTLTIVFRESLRLILSPQAPTRQIWAAFRDRAWHFSRDVASEAWVDDRGQGVELYKLVEDITRAEVGQVISVQKRRA